MASRELVLESRRRRRAPLFGLLSRAAAEALARRSIAPFAEAADGARASGEDLLFAAVTHGVTGLLARLSEETPGALAPPFHEALAAERRRVGARGERLAGDVARLGRLAERAGLPFVPLKGSVLAPLRYRDLSLRPAADVDLLALPGTLGDWRHLLLDAGYRETGETAKHLAFAHPDARPPAGFGEDPEGPRPVDLHAHVHERLFGRRVDVTEAYTARLAAGTLHGVPALLPDDDALLLHLLLHLTPHVTGRGARLVQLADLSRLVPSREAARLAGEALGEIAWGSAHLSARALPGCLPPAFLEALAPRARSAYRRERWLSRPGLLAGEEESTILVLAELPLCATPRDALRRFAAVLPERALLAGLYGEGTPYAAALLRYARDRVAPPRATDS